MNLEKNVGIVVFAAAIGLGMLSVGVHAQDGYSSSGNRQTAPSPSGDMAARVKQALHSDSNVYAKHIDVSMEKGKVVMTGFVSSAKDLEEAVHVANKTAGAKNVVNKLTIKENDDSNTSGG